MEKVVAIYNRLSWFLNLFLVFVLGGALMLSFIPKGQLELGINTHNNEWLDRFFFYITYLGNGWAFVAFVLAVFAVNRKYFWLCGLTGVFCLLLSLCMKYLVFTHEVRPPGFFSDSLHLHFVPGAPVLYANSFPSGHTLSVFALFCLLSFMVAKKAWQVAFFLLAVLVGFSRMYLLAHFKEDVYAGAILGTSASLLMIYLSERFVPEGNLIRIKTIKVKAPDAEGR